MENNTFLLISSPSSRESTRSSQGVAGNPDLAGGILLAYFFLGLASYIWAFHSQRNKLRAFKEAIVLSCSGLQGRLRGIQNIYSCLLPLFFMDILNAILMIILAAEFIGSRCSSQINCDYIIIGWHLSRYFGVILHLENVLVYLYFLGNLSWRAQQRGLYISLIMLLLVFVPLYVFVSQWTVYGLGVTTFALAFNILFRCAGSNMSPALSTQKKPIVWVAMLTFLIVFLPFFILECIIYSEISYGTVDVNSFIAYLNVMFFTSIQVPMDGLLSYFILKVPLEEEELRQEQPQQRHVYENQSYVTHENVNNVNLASAP